MREYVDMNLYQEVIFLKHFFQGQWVVENVIPYYEPLIKPKIIGRNCFWSNFNIPIMKTKKGTIGSMNGKYKDFKSQDNWYAKKPLEERNMVNSELGLHIFKFAFKNKQEVLF